MMRPNPGIARSLGLDTCHLDLRPGVLLCHLRPEGSSPSPLSALFPEYSRLPFPRPETSYPGLRLGFQYLTPHSLAVVTLTLAS